MKTFDVPVTLPGSAKAITLGCTCPAIDNGRGAGAYRDEHGNVHFWIADNCRLHGDSVKIVLAERAKEGGLAR